MSLYSKNNIFIKFEKYNEKYYYEINDLSIQEKHKLDPIEIEEEEYIYKLKQYENDQTWEKTILY